MHGKDIITMSQMELRRVSVINKVIDKIMTQLEASKILELSTRQIRRITKRVSKEGDKGVIHKSRGRPSTQALPEKVKNKILKLCKTKYEGFNPLFASEKLFEIEKIKISRETLRSWFKEKNIPYKMRKKRPHRAWRERRHFFGQMIQADGSHHDWFEGRGHRCVLIGYIDDATSNVFARFYEYEGTFPFMDSFKRYTRKYGLPCGIYLDRHSTYKSTMRPSIEDELNNKEPLTHAGRALEELGVEVIFANSPQAKGRIERLFRTFQDRLIKEMRLKDIKTVKEANKFLKYYLSVYNRRFKVEAIEKGDLHRPLPKGIDLNRVLCIKTKRILNNDSTVAHNKKLYLVLDKIQAKSVFVEERLNGKLLIAHNSRALRYRKIAKRPKAKPKKPKYIFTMVRKERARPSVDHPLKGPFFRARYKHNPQYSQKEKVAKRKRATTN